MVKYMFEMPTDSDFEMLYANLKTQGTVSFWSTSFIRGTTLDNAIIIVDEFQNLNFHELDSIITRIGQESKIMFCGDATQSDLIKSAEKNGIADFMRILRTMPSMDIIEFGVEDIVRSGLCKEYLIAKKKLDPHDIASHYRNYVYKKMQKKSQTSHTQRIVSKHSCPRKRNCAPEQHSSVNPKIMNQNANLVCI